MKAAVPVRPPAGSVPLHDRLGGASRLRHLLRHFYGDIRQHHLLGPIFHRHVHDWPVHLDTIQTFWTTATGGPPGYSGHIPALHAALDLQPEHFNAWLGLWRHHCRAWIAEREAGELIALAERVADRIRIACGLQPDCPPPALPISFRHPSPPASGRRP